MPKITTKKNVHLNNINRPISLVYYIPIIAIIFVVPLITFAKIIELPPSQVDFWKGGAIHFDFFCYWKSVYFVIFVALGMIIYAILFFRKKKSFYNELKYYIPLGIYVFFVVISSVLSQNKDVAFNGFIEMYQGMWVLLGYIAITFIMINFINSERDINIIVNTFAFLIVFVGILGLSQYFGFDFYKSSLGQKFILPMSMWDTKLNFSFGKYTIYASMYNTNFVGSYGALVLPIAFVLYLTKKGLKNQIIFGIVTILAYTTWLGSNSRAGYIGIGFSFIIGVIIFRKTLKENYIKVIIMSAIFISIAFLFNNLSGGRVSSQFSKLSISKENEKMDNIYKGSTRFEDISVKGNTLTIKTKTEMMKGTVIEGNLSFKDDNGIDIPFISNDDINYTFEDERYNKYTFSLTPNQPLVTMTVDNKTINYYIENDDIKVLSINNRLMEPINAPYAKIFDGKETFASNRGYIWSRTLPIMKDTFLIGYGPDNYCMAFPQDDISGKFNGGMGINIIVDKPHNMFMQIAVNTGGLSIIALIIMWGIYFIDCMRMFIKSNMNNMAQYVGAAVFLSIMGYLGAAMFNDSIISVAPLFWVLLGFGISINRLIMNSKI